MIRCRQIALLVSILLYAWNVQKSSSWTTASPHNLLPLRRPKKSNKKLLESRCYCCHSPTTTDADDEFYMQLALQEARQAAKENEVPIGALIVRRNEKKDEILARQHNRVEQLHDASAHAELLALREASDRIGNWRLTNTTLYSTLEPCPMCCAAAQAFRVDRIVYGAPDHRLGAIVSSDVKLLNKTHPYHTINDVESGVCGEECGKILTRFFQERRKQRKGAVARETDTFPPRVRWWKRLMKRCRRSSS